jgi:multiple sugar transport system substrate-binding protein
VSDGRKWTMALAFVLLASVTAACGGDDSGIATLNWYINPDNGGQAELAAKCSAASNGAFRINTSVLPNDATSQREQLVRRLAAKDSSIDLMSLDPPFIPEFAEAGFLRPYSDSEAQELTAGALSGPIESGTWDGKLMGAPFWANTQLLWYRKSVAQAAGINPARDPVTWSQIIDLASNAGKTVEVQGNLYEGYMVLISALVSSAGGKILENPEAGKNVKPAIDSDAGRKAAAVIQQLGRSKAADPALSTSDEEAGRAAFQGPRGGFMVNWAYIYGAAQEAVAAGTLDKAVLDDIGWGRYPRVDAAMPSRPPLGGINLGIGAFGKHQEEALQAVRCITSLESQTQYMLKSKNPGARAAVYDNAEVRKVFPMADDLRASLDAGAPRPRTPYYTDVSTAVQRSFHPPASVDPNRAPAKAGKLIVDVLKDKVLL